ncbi:glycosyltransferase family 4 protein (plasmid) [Cetobacterium somerae]|uniref:glycosyltransferase family 4 protein n=1 Tax=Cetobacterium somerae TaxID=188913 RepID=UPI001F0586A0|nr:glycosyltransferase family 4 protein [Cetobacterium somerae]UPO98525.1 glycosyltransferase family 4 protein [Cetobacterium somerae]
MKILYLHQYFNTNKEAGGTRSYEFSKFLSEDNEVTIITGSQNYIEGILKFRVISTKTKYNQQMNFFQRIYSFFHYLIKAIYLGNKEREIDIIFATSTPLTIGVPALILKRFKKTKLIFEVRDVWPDIPVELGFIKNKILIKILKWFEMKIYNSSEQIIVASEGMYENLIKKGVKSYKIEVIHNLSNVYLYDQVTEIEKNIERKKYNLEKHFICIHPGTMGFVNGLDYILDVGKIIQEKDRQIKILLVGEGKEKERLKARIRNEKIKNILIMDSLPKLEIVKLIKTSDLGLMITKKFKILEDNSANKFFDFLAAGLPVLVNYGGWQKKVLEEFKAGYGCSPDNPKEMADKILMIKESKEKQQLSKSAYELARKKYSTKIACEKLNNIIKKIEK